MIQRVSLMVSRGAGTGKVFELQPGENMIGRWDGDNASELVVDLEEFDPDAKVSRHHAVIYWHGAELAITDLGSLNGTFLNGLHQLQKDSSVRINHGDEIIVGKTFLKLQVVR